jgi:DNA-binding transcriptional LysR family regulator
MHRLDWSDLQYILAVANNGSLAAAARALGVNHSTVQRRIASFEALHEVSVFDRRPDGYKLTIEGQQLLETAREVEQAVWGLERRIAGKDLKLEGTIRLTTTDTLLHTLVGRLLPGFRALYPDIRFEASTTNSILSIARRDADVAIRPAPSIAEGLVGTKAGEFRFQAYASAGYVAAHPDVAVEDMDWLSPGDTLADSTPGRWMRRHMGRARIAMTCDSIMAIAAAVRQGMGVGLLPSYVGRDDAALVQLDFDTSDAHNGLWVLTHPDLANAARIHTFLDYMAEGLGRLLDGTDEIRHTG